MYQIMVLPACCNAAQCNQIKSNSNTTTLRRHTVIPHELPLNSISLWAERKLITSWKWTISNHRYHTLPVCQIKSYESPESFYHPLSPLRADDACCQFGGYVLLSFVHFTNHNVPLTKSDMYWVIIAWIGLPSSICKYQKCFIIVLPFFNWIILSAWNETKVIPVM